MLPVLNHTFIALFIQGLVWLLTGNLIYGALLAIAYFYGREFAQAEYRWMDANNTNRSAMPWYVGFDIRNWTYDALVNDFVLPSIAVICVAWYGY